MHGLERIGAGVVIAYLHSLVTRLQWDIDRIQRDYPELKLTATKDMMV